MAIFTGSLVMDLLGIVTALLVIVYAYFKWTYQFWKTAGVPYTEPSIPFGSFQSNAITSETVRLYREIRKKGWRHGGEFLLLRPVWFVVDLELIKHAMTKDFSHFTDRGSYTNEKDDPLSCHLFAVGGTKWRNLRMKLTPTFTSGKMKSMFQTVIDCGLILEKYIEENIENKEAVDIKYILGSFSTDIIGSCAFGLDCNSFKDPDSPFRKHGNAFFERVNGVQSFLRSICLNFPDFARRLGLCITPKATSDFFLKVVRDTVEYREKNNYVRKDFLQLLIDVRNDKTTGNNEYQGDGTSLTMNEIAAQSFVFFIAGFETSSTTMTFALYELATHQDLQEKVRQEITTVLAKHDNQMTYDSLSELKYMKQVIDETLRMYPPVPFVTRDCTEDYKVPGEDIIIKKNTRLFIPIRGIHYDEEYYKNPEVFDPERFNEENKAGRHHYAHLPFGEGPRICIGERFGIMQTKVGITSILRKFRVKLSEKTQLPLKLKPRSFFPTAEGGMWLSIEKL